MPVLALTPTLTCLLSLRQSRSVIMFLCCINQHHLQQSFANVPITPDGVETTSFLEAADGLMDLFGKFIISSQQLRLSLNPFPPTKISWAALSLDLSSQISEVTLPYVRPRPFPDPTPPPPFFFVWLQTRCISGGPHSVQCPQVRVRNSREPRSG